MRIVRSARTGRFVEKDMAVKAPNETIVQTPRRTSGRMMELVAAQASKISGQTITPVMARSVMQAYRRLPKQRVKP